MSSARQEVSTGRFISRPRGRPALYLNIATSTRALVVVGSYIAVKVPDLAPWDTSIVPIWIVGQLTSLVLNHVLGWIPGTVRYLRLFGVVDAALIGYAVWMTGGTSSPFVALFTLVVAFHGIFYGLAGLWTGALPSVIMMVAATLASPAPQSSAALGVEIGVVVALALLTAFAGQGERTARRRLREQARRGVAQARQLQALYETSATIGGEVEAEGLLTTALDRTQDLANELWGGDAFSSLILFDRETHEFVVARVGGGPRELQPGMRILFSALPSIERDLNRTDPHLVEREGLAELKQFFHWPNTATAFTAPLVVGGETVGILSVRSDSGAIPTADQLELLQTIANHIASALDRVRILNEERRLRKEATALFELARELNTIVEVGGVLNRIAQASIDLADVDFCGIGLLSADGRSLERTAWAASADLPSQEEVEAPDPLSLGEFSQVFEQLRPLEIENYYELSESVRRGAELAGIKRSLVFPIMLRERAVGMMFFGLSAKSRRFNLSQWQVGEAITGLAAVTIENVRNFEFEKESAAELKELDRLKTEMVSTASHELRSPLTSIAGYARTLLRPGVQFTEEERREFLTVIDQQARQLARLIDELLTVSRIEEGRLALALGRIDLVGLVLEVIAAAKMRTQLHTFELDMPDDLPHIVADESKITEIVTNLIDNAIKYSAQGGRIQIGVKMLDQEVHLWVSDEGNGIPDEELARVFEKYYQISGRRGTGGSGLGLYIVQELVNAHNGRVWVESEQGKGSTFHVVFPQRRATDRLPVH